MQVTQGAISIPRLMCTKEVADQLGVSERTAARLLAEGSIQAFKMNGGRWRTTHDALKAYIEEHMGAVPEEQTA